MNNVKIALAGQSYQATVEHLTYDQGTLVTTNTSGSSSVTLINSLITGVSSYGNVSVATNTVAKVSSSAGIYQTVGGGSHYLGTNIYRGVGTNLDAGMAAQLAQRTTYPPTAYTNVTFTNAMTFPLQAPRDTNTAPDLGYHYDPLDYTFGGCSANSNVTFNAGVAAGWFRTTSGTIHAGYGLQPTNGVTVTFNGTATAPDYWVRLNTVQEQDTTAGTGTGGIDGWATNVATAPILQGTFLFASTMASEGGSHFARNDGYIDVRLTHSELWSGSVGGGSGNFSELLSLTNCLANRCSLTVFGTNGILAMRNTTMRGGTLTVTHNLSSAWTSDVADCVFDGTTISLNAGSNTNLIHYAYNAYLTNANRLTPTNVSDVIVTNFNWQTGPLGRFYLPTNSTLINAGHTNANQLNLFYFTTQTNQAVESNSIIDIGYHYVAVDGSGNPFDTDANGLPDYSEDANGNGLGDVWEYYWFGNYSHSGSELDAAGNTLSSDYENYVSGTATNDPNIISFSLRLGNQHFQATNSGGSFVILAGTPSYQAVLVNSTNFSGATWNAYDGIAHLNLGPTDGAYEVWFGMKGIATNATVTWIGTTVYLDRAAPALVITSPTNNSTVTSPWLQLKGYCLEELRSVTYDLSNALAVVTNLAGSPTISYLDTNTLTYTTNYFQCYDILLTNGSNTITVHGTDKAGNIMSTNISVTLSYASASNPVVQLTWPQDGMSLCQSTFDLRGWTEDAAATVTASITDTNGNTNTIYGMVERTGVLWVQGLPLADGTNWVSLTVTNSAGLGSVTNFALTKNSMILALSGVSGDLWDPTVDVSGAVSDTTAAIYVNGVQGTNNGDGTWNAYNVPVSPSGMATFDMKAVPVGGDDPDASTTTEKAAEIIMEGMKWSYKATDHFFGAPPYPYLTQNQEKWDWTGPATGGTLMEIWQRDDYTGGGRDDGQWGDGTATFPIWPNGLLAGAKYDLQLYSGPETFYVLPENLYLWADPDTGYISLDGPDLGGLGAYLGGGMWKFEPQEQGKLSGGSSDVYHEWTGEKTAEPQWVLHTGGSHYPGQKCLFVLSATAIEEVTSKGKIVEGTSVPVQQIAINGKQQDESGATYFSFAADSDEKLSVETGVSLSKVGLIQTKYVPKHTTGCIAPKNPDTHRLVIGIGEIVAFTGMRPGTTWSLIGDGLLLHTPDGSGASFFSSHSPCTETVIANFQGLLFPTTFTVIAPTGVSSLPPVNVGLGSLGTNSIGADTKFTIQIEPQTVTFFNNHFHEEGPSNVLIHWPSGSNQLYSIRYNDVGLNTCGGTYTDEILDGPFPVTNLLTNGTYGSCSFTVNWKNQYLNQAGVWTDFSPMHTTTTFNANKTTQQDYQDAHGAPQGPWQ